MVITNSATVQLLFGGFVGRMADVEMPVNADEIAKSALGKPSLYRHHVPLRTVICIPLDSSKENNVLRPVYMKDAGTIA